ncbi:MAG: NAD(P)H-hydrate dehydratase [Bacillota bacterium]
MFIVTGQEMARIDRLAVEHWGIPELVLMENAGIQVVEYLKKKFSPMKGKKVVIAAGKGNNGGDGLVIARHLSNLGADVKMFLLGTKEYKGAALVNYKIAQKLPIKWHTLDNENSLHLFKLSLHYTDIVIDALFGTGFKGEMSSTAAKAINIINESGCYILAVDIPSGINADNGQTAETCVHADTTVTFALPKLGLIVNPGCDFAGNLAIVDISIPNTLVDSLNINKILLTPDDVYNYIPKRSKDCHKGNFGHLLIVGGSQGMVGAVHLAAQGAFALGAGLVTGAVPRSIQSSLAGSFPELITMPLAETPQGSLGFLSGAEIASSLLGKTAVVLGPGLGRNSELLSLIKWLLEQIEIPIVIDADGLNALAEDLEILRVCKAPVILTPHPGEMARLLKTDTAHVQSDRIKSAVGLAETYKVWVVLKGVNTIIAAPDGKIYINTTGSPSLATAGTGDVLSGMIGALVGQCEDIDGAICTAVFLHGLAGELVTEERGSISSKAGDIVEAVPKILQRSFPYEK